MSKETSSPNSDVATTPSARSLGNPPPDSVVVQADDATQQVVTEALHSLWAVANTLSRIQPAERERFGVTVFGSARIQPDHMLYREVKRLTTRLSEMRCDIITGGGPGLMQAANEGSQAGDPHDEASSIGVGIQLPFETGANPFVEKVYEHETFFTRLHQFVRLSHAFVVVSGGIGTTLEALMVWQLLQVRHIHNVPLVFVGNMWRGLLTWAKHSMLSTSPPLASEADLNLPVCVDTVDEALATLRPYIDAFKQQRP
ncbi:MAG TPA: LOG family protein [Sorangium sp.]|nr:LOG family protein [Sorangium sp.]